MINSVEIWQKWLVLEGEYGVVLLACNFVSAAGKAIVVVGYRCDDIIVPLILGKLVATCHDITSSGIDMVLHPP